MEKLMKTFTKSLVQWVWLSLWLSIFVLWIFFVKWTDPLTATNWETLTADKWNALVEKVNTIQWSTDDTCPTWFTKVEKQWNVLWCIQNAQNAPLNSYEAQLHCFNQFWWRLPFWVEWFVSIQNYNLENEIDWWERTADLVSEATAWWQSWRNGFWLVWNWYATLYSRSHANLNTYNFRCFIPR